MKVFVLERLYKTHKQQIEPIEHQNSKGIKAHN